MTNRQIARHPSQNVLIKHLAHQTHIFVQKHFVLVKHSDTSRFLAAVLQGVKTEIRQIGNRLLGRQNSKDSARFFHPIGTLSHELLLLHRAPVQKSIRSLHHARRRGRASAYTCCSCSTDRSMVLPTPKDSWNRPWEATVPRTVVETSGLDVNIVCQRVN